MATGQISDEKITFLPAFPVATDSLVHSLSFLCWLKVQIVYIAWHGLMLTSNSLEGGNVSDGLSLHCCLCYFSARGVAKTQKHRNTEMHKDPKGERQECATQNPPNTCTETNTPTQTLRDTERKTQTQQLAVSLIDGFCCEQNVSSRFETFCNV